MMLLIVAVTSAGVPLKVVSLRLPSSTDNVTVKSLLSTSVIVKPPRENRCIFVGLQGCWRSNHRPIINRIDRDADRIVIAQGAIGNTYFQTIRGHRIQEWRVNNAVDHGGDLCRRPAESRFAEAAIIHR